MTLSEKLKGLGVTLIAEIAEDPEHSLCICKANIDVLIEQDLNARYMSDNMFRQLTENIKNRGLLESLPYCCLTAKGIEVVSGHHRLRMHAFRNVKLLFLPSQLEDFEKAISLIDGDEDKLILANIKGWPQFREAVLKTMKEEDIRSIGTAVARMSEIVLNHYQETTE